MRTVVVATSLMLVLAAHAAEVNLAAGQPCAFAPQPNYSLTAKGDTDAADLTDGRLSDRPDMNMWFESHVVGWQYTPVFNVRVDLGQVQPIGEVVMRFLGGSAQGGIAFPTFVSVVVSDDGQTYHRVAEYSRWQPGDAQRCGLPPEAGKSWIHPLRFADLKTRGRYVGFVVGGTGMVCSDELYVHQGTHDPASVKFDAAQALDFSVTRPQVAFVKPFLVLPTGIVSPQPLGLLDGSGVKRDVTLHLQLPPQVEVLEPTTTQQKLPDGRTDYALTLEASGTSTMPKSRLYVRSSLPAGATAQMGYYVDWGDGKSQPATIPLRVAAMTPAPWCKRMTMAMAWWSLGETKTWPEGLAAHRAVGMNTVSTIGRWMKPDDTELWAFADEARAQGFRMLNVDSTWHEMLNSHRGDASMFCQFADGKTNGRMCPSYRGEWYVAELNRVADQCVRLKADLLSTDIELWNWQGPTDAEKCTRCQAAKQASGIEKWEDWKLQQGYDMWRDLAQAVDGAMQQAGLKRIDIGCYDWRPGHNYQFFWPFDRLYRDGLLRNSQTSTYTPLYAYHVALIGDESREDRKLLPRTEGLPWLTPGDAGAFTAEALRCAMLECFLNGSRGIHFWSSRYWDGEYLLGFNQAVREVAPVEDIIVDGALFEGATVEAPARVSGMIRGKDVALLVGEYTGAAPGTVTITIEAPAAADVIEVLSDKKLGEVKAGKQQLRVDLGEHRSKVLLLKAR